MKLLRLFLLTGSGITDGIPLKCTSNCGIQKFHVGIIYIINTLCAIIDNYQYDLLCR